MTRIGGSFNSAEMSDADRTQLKGLRKRKMDLLDEIEHIKNELKDVDSELESMYYVDDSGKSRLKIVGNARKRFNKDPASGVQYLIEKGLIDDDPKAIAEWLYHTEGLSKSALGDYLGLHDDKPVLVLEHYTKCFDFTGMFIVDAIRTYLKTFRLPGESQKIDRIMDNFSVQYVSLNPKSFPSADACHSIAFSAIMLNTLLYNPNIKDKITIEGYIDMCKEYLDSKLVTVEILTGIYDSLRTAQFAMPQEEAGTAEIHLNADREGWLYKQSSGQFMTGPLSWKRRWFVLSEQCLYYFEQTADREPRGIIPLQNVGIRRVEPASRPHMFEIFSLSDDRIKACKTEQDGRMVEGRHSVYRICAANQEDLREVVHSIHDSRWLEPVESVFEGKEKAEEVEREFEEFDPFKALEEEVTARCTSCNCSIDGGEGRESLLAHYQSLWHRHNVRRAQQGRQVFTEEEFEESKNEDDNSSISSSDSEDDYSRSATSSARVFFAQDGTVFSIYRAILHAGESRPSRPVFTRPLDCAILLLAGGHFAGAIFKNDSMTVHKTFTRYVVRAKQGGAQSANDSAKGAAHSAGAALRRYNERTLRNEIAQLLKSWTNELKATPLIFIRCATYQRSVFHVDGGIQKDDPRLRTIPFETRRPSTDELRRTWQRLAMVAEHGSRDDFLKEEKRRREMNKQRVALQRKKREQQSMAIDYGSDDETEDTTRIRKTDHLKPVPEVEVATEDDKWPTVPVELRREMYEALRADSVVQLTSCIERAEDRQAVMSYLNDRRFAPDSSTFLHIAASRGLDNVLQYLLASGCNPGTKNSDSKVPYVVSMNKVTKKVFVTFRSDNPKAWEWTRCHIPEPVELTEEQSALLAEKKKERKNRQKEKLKEKKEIQRKEAEEQAAQAAFAALPEREKRARAAEARFQALEHSTPRCCNCASPLPAVPFEYLDVKLCSPACVAAHRAKFSG